MHSTDSRYVVGLENILFAGVAVHFQPGHVRDWGGEGVNYDYD